MTVSAEPTFRRALPADPNDLLLDRLANGMAPLLVDNEDDLGTARAVAVRAVASYQPRTQADLLSFARTVSFSLSALEVIAEARAKDLSPAMKLRYLGKAIALNRAAERSEEMAERRRRQQEEMQTTACPQAGPSMITEATLREAMQRDLATRTAGAESEDNVVSGDLSGQQPAHADAEADAADAFAQAAVAEVLQRYRTQVGDDAAPPADMAARVRDGSPAEQPAALRGPGSVAAETERNAADELSGDEGADADLMMLNRVASLRRWLQSAPRHPNQSGEAAFSRDTMHQALAGQPPLPPAAE